MPNPFPGMNPYLEDPVHWRTVHHGLIHGFFVELNRVLPPDFFVRIEARTYEATETQWEVPNENLRAAALYDLPYIITFFKRKVEEAFLVVHSVKEERPVAFVEFISPISKEDGAGREEYLRTQKERLSGAAHLLEIDLLREGKYAIAPPEVPARRRIGNYDYIISLHRRRAGERYELWPRAVRDRLPRITLPLTDEAGDVSFDLQAVIDCSYDESGMERRINYREEPVPPLTDEDAEWTDTLLKNAGLR